MASTRRYWWQQFRYTVIGPSIPLGLFEVQLKTHVCLSASLHQRCLIEQPAASFLATLLPKKCRVSPFSPRVAAAAAKSVTRNRIRHQRAGRQTGGGGAFSTLGVCCSCLSTPPT